MFLTPNDFDVHHGNLVCKVKGFVFVFFISRDCGYCEDVKPAFNRLTQIIEGCRFAYVDVDQNQQQMVRLSYQTADNKITYVPLLLLFINGQSVGQFFPDEENPENNLPKMKDFLLSHNSQQPQQSQPQPQQQPEIPPYSIGIPGNLDKKVCYVHFDNAYRK
jgi:thiol-disulfide isomerase/thioredoxin